MAQSRIRKPTLSCLSMARRYSSSMSKCTLARLGKIACWKTNDLKSFEYCGVVLSEPHHLSFPFVFRSGDRVYMLPETEQAGELTLYRFELIARTTHQGAQDCRRPLC